MHMSHITLFSLIYVLVVDIRRSNVLVEVKYLDGLSMSEVNNIREDLEIKLVVLKNSSWTPALVFDTPTTPVYTLGLSEDKDAEL